MQEYGTVGKPDWGNRDVYIVGGGPSLKPYSQKLFLLYQRGYVVAVNDSHKYTYFPDAIVSLDHTWLAKNFEKYKNFYDFPGPVFVAVEEGKVPMTPSPNLTYLQRLPRRHVDPSYRLSENPGQITNGMNSGYAALNFAYLKGAKRIFLLGFDFKEIDGKSHYHSGYTWYNRSSVQRLFPIWAKAFDETVPQLRDRGIEVFNCSPDSILTAFPKKSYEEVLG